MKSRESLALGVLLAGTLWSTTAEASEPWLLTGSLGGSTAINEPYWDSFTMGASADVAVYRPLVPYVLVGGRLGGVLLGEDEYLGQAAGNHGVFTMARFAAVLRLRPQAIGADDPGRSAGLWIEVGAGPGLSEGGSLLHAVLDAGVGFDIPFFAVTMGPALRYQQVIETGESFAGRDARLASLGLEVVYGDVAAPVAR